MANSGQHNSCNHAMTISDVAVTVSGVPGAETIGCSTNKSPEIQQAPLVTAEVIQKNESEESILGTQDGDPLVDAIISSVVVQENDNVNIDSNYNTVTNELEETNLERPTQTESLDKESNCKVKTSAKKVDSRDEKRQAEVREELVHPDTVFITEQQFKLDRDCAEAALRAHVEGITVNLQVAQSTFYLSSFHFKEENNSMRLYNDPTGTPRRLEWVDFVRRRKDGYVLYLWDQRNAIMLSLLDADTNKYQTRFFVAMTTLYMQLGDGSVSKDFVLLDILVRMDAKTYVDALVGVIATGEVKLWKHSQEHLRFLHCDYMHEIERGENFWIARREQFYSDRGLIYLPQRMVPRDLDAPRTRFAISKEYITHYKHAYKTNASVEKNFNKWTLMPGRFKSLKEYAAMASESIDRHGNLAAASAKENSNQKAKSDADKKVKDEINKRRVESRKKNQEEKRKEEERKLLEKYKSLQVERKEEQKQATSSKNNSNVQPTAWHEEKEEESVRRSSSKPRAAAKPSVLIIEDGDEELGRRNTSLKRTAASAISRDKGTLFIRT